MARRAYNPDTSMYTLELIDATDKAILVTNLKNEQVWISKSALIEFTDNEDGTCEVEVTDNLAMAKELC